MPKVVKVTDYESSHCLNLARRISELGLSGSAIRDYLAMEPRFVLERVGQVPGEADIEHILRVLRGEERTRYAPLQPPETRGDDSGSEES